MVNLKNEIEKKYKKICKLNVEENECVFRGHIPDMSDYFEDVFARFLSEELGKDYYIYVDFTIDNGKRPDIIITKKTNDKEVIKGVIELKVNLGYVRDGSSDLKKHIENEVVGYINVKEKLKIYYTRQESYLYKNDLVHDLTDQQVESIKRHIENKNKEKSIKAEKTICREKKIDYLVVSLTSSNISKNKLYDDEKSYYNTFNKQDNPKRLAVLFDGWYYDLKERKEDMDVLNKYIEKIKKS